MLGPWIVFFAVVALLLALDLGVLHRRPREMPLRHATLWTLFWVFISLAFNAAVYFIYQHGWFGDTLPGNNGAEAATSFFAGYLLEKALSVDNIFVMALLFRQFGIEPQYQRRVLFWGILGAIVSRGLMIGIGVWLVQRFKWLFYVFGGYLAFAGMKMFISGTHEEGVAAPGRLIRLLQRILPITDEDHEGRFALRVNGKLYLTRLSVVLLVIELSDIVFALDSVPAVLAITTDSFIVLTSNVFAILGLRALYFVLAGMLARFRHLQLALAVILVVIGAKMFLHDVYPISTFASLVAIGSTLLVGVVASLMDRR